MTAKIDAHHAPQLIPLRPSAQGSDAALRILHLLHAMPMGLTRREVQAFTDLTDDDVRAAIGGLQYRGRVQAAGAGHHARWQLRGRPIA